MIELENALNLLLQEAKTHTQTTEFIPITEALGYILAEDIYAKKDMPPFSNAAMDGYAVSIEDRETTVSIAGTILAGDKATKSIQKGQTLKIMTGAPIPLGCDAVVPFEQTTLTHTKECRFGEIGDKVLLGSFKKGDNIRKKGEEYLQNTQILQKGNTINPYTLGFLASQGFPYTKVFTPLKISIFSSGDEIREFWESSDLLEIYNSNTILSKSLLELFHFKAHYGGKIPDNPLELKNTFTQIIHNNSYDVLILTGGASKGEADFILEVFRELGASVLFDGLNIKPGKPLKALKLGKTYILVLPGNPLAANVLLRLLGIPFLKALSGDKAIYPQYIKIPIAQEYQLHNKKPQIILSHLENGELLLTLGGKYGAGELQPLLNSSFFTLFEKDFGIIQRGDMIKAVPYNLLLGDKPSFFTNLKENK